MSAPTPASAKGKAPKKGHELRPTESPPGYGDIPENPLLALGRLHVFRNLTKGELDRIARVSEVVKFPQDLVVPRGGDGSEPEAFYFVLKGQIAFAEF